MANTRTHDLVAVTGTYKKDGQEKKRYMNVGSAFTDDQGRISLKLDAVPVTPEWSGWLSLYPVTKLPQDQQPKREPTRTNAESEDDDVPF